jgi:hypothetical protein
VVGPELAVVVDHVPLEPKPFARTETVDEVARVGRDVDRQRHDGEREGGVEQRPTVAPVGDGEGHEDPDQRGPGLPLHGHRRAEQGTSGQEPSAEATPIVAIEVHGDAQGGAHEQRREQAVEDGGAALHDQQPVGRDEYRRQRGPPHGLEEAAHEQPGEGDGGDAGDQHPQAPADLLVAEELDARGDGPLGQWRVLEVRGERAVQVLAGGRHVVRLVPGEPPVRSDPHRPRERAEDGDAGQEEAVPEPPRKRGGTVRGAVHAM